MRFHLRVPVRFRDLDALGHVHHTAPLLYLEEARAAYWREVVGRPAVADIDYVLGDISIRYHDRIRYPATVDVGVRVAEMRGKSLRMEFEIRAEDGTLLVSGSTVQVMFDYGAGKAVGIGEEVRERVAAWETGDGPVFG